MGYIESIRTDFAIDG